MSMKIQFDANLDYQRDAIESVTGVFAGQEICQTNFTVAPLHSWEEGSLFHGIQEDTLGIGNRLRLLDEDIHAIYGSVNTAMDKWLPSEQWQRAEKLHLS